MDKILFGTSSTNIAAPQMQARLPTVPAPAPMAMPSQPPAPPPPAPAMVTVQKPSDNAKEKCRNFLAELLEVSSREPKTMEKTMRSLIQRLIDAQMEPEAFCDTLEKITNTSPQPCLIGFLKKSLPLLRQSLVNGELVIEGIKPPMLMVECSGAVPAQSTSAATNLQVPRAVSVTQSSSAVSRGAKSPVAVFSNVPGYSQKEIQRSEGQVGAATNLQTVFTPGKSLLKNGKSRVKSALAPAPAPAFGADCKIIDCADINALATLYANLSKEWKNNQRTIKILNKKILLYKKDYLASIAQMQAIERAESEQRDLDEQMHEPEHREVNLTAPQALESRKNTRLEPSASVEQPSTSASGSSSQTRPQPESDQLWQRKRHMGLTNQDMHFVVKRHNQLGYSTAFYRHYHK